MSRVFDSVQVHRTTDFIQRHTRTLLFALLAAAVIPFFLLTQYAHPSADDFCYASLFGREGFWNHIKGEYLGWKGRYTAIFFTAAYHKAGGMLATYGWGLLLLLTSFCLAIYVYVHSLIEAAGPRIRKLFFAAGLAALYLGTMPKVPAGLYWLDGALQYQLGGIFLLLSFAALFDLYRTGSSASAWLTCLCVFLATGTTELAMITLVAVVAILAFNRIAIHGRHRLPWAAVVVVTILSAALLLLAPGNAVRAEHASPDAGQFWYSFSHAWFHSGRVLASWAANPGLWLATAVFLPAALRLVYLDGIRKDANWPRFLIVLALVPAVVWSCFFGLWWAAATNPPGRALNMIYLLFLAGWFAGVLELVGVIARHRPLTFTEEVFPVPLRLAGLATTALFAGFLLLQSHARTAVGDLLYRAPEYDGMMRDRYARIALRRESPDDDGRPTMSFAAVADPPRVLMYTDIQADPGNWRNGCFARYFGLQSVSRQ